MYSTHINVKYLSEIVTWLKENLEPGEGFFTPLGSLEIRGQTNKWVIKAVKQNESLARPYYLFFEDPNDQLLFSLWFK